MENCFDDLPVLLWSEGLEIHGDSCDPFYPSSSWVAGIWYWLLDAIFGVNGVKVVGVGGSLGTDILQCGSIIGLILGIPVKGSGREGRVGCCAPFFLPSDIVKNCRVN